MCVGLVAGVVGGFGDPVLVLGACFGVERTVVMGQEQFVLVGNVFVVASSSPDGIAVECGVGVGVMVVVGWGWDGGGRDGGACFSRCLKSGLLQFS